MSKLCVPEGMRVGLVDGDLRLIGNMLPPVTVLTSPDNDNTLYFDENGLLHREDGPARKVSYETKHGFEYWYKNGLLHREDGPAFVSEESITEWFVDGKRHRAGGPAREYKDGHKEWYHHGQKHRLDGPAYESPKGIKKYFIYDVEYTLEEFELAVIKLKE